MKEENKNTNYPRFIPNKPCGIDKFEGQSQERLTNAVANHIVSIDNDNDAQNLSRIIGLEGGWGVGKSNVIKQLKKHDKIKDNYYLFEYDAWGHQEDLQRRSFLEILTTELIEKNLLSGDTEINIKGGGIKKVSWNEKLKYLLACKTETSTEKRPKLSIGIIAFVLAAIFTSVFASIADTLKDICLFISIILPFIPFLVAAIVVLFILRKRNNDWKDIFNEIFSIYNGKIENEVSYETISEEEPTLTEFKNWLKSISDHLGTKNKELIVVYDNMDRLPAEKVKELWSSIHTFFSESTFDNVWAIIPFDEKHLSCAFGEDDNKEQLTKYFISKTFPVVYRVTPPVITDFKKIFNTLFEEAFGNTISDEQKDLINRIFRLEEPNATVRELIEFINQLVALKNIWREKIDILFIAIFVLKRDNILSNPVEQILSGQYLTNNIKGIIPDDHELQKNISALVYGVLPNDAEQIPMQKHIDSCLRAEENYDINKFSDCKHFISILQEKVSDSDLDTDSLIIALSKLDYEFTTQNQPIIDIWKNVIDSSNVKAFIECDKLDENNFKSIIDIYKILLNKKPLSINFKEDIRKKIWDKLNSKVDSPEYLEIIAIQLGHISQILQLLPSNNAQNPVFTQLSKIKLSDEQIKIVSETIDYYAEYGDLLLESTSKNIPALHEVLKYMTEKKLGDSLSLEKVLPKFFEIKDKIKVSEELLLKQLNHLGKDKDTITLNDIERIIPKAEFFHYSAIVTENELATHLNKVAIEKLSTIPKDDLYKQKQNANDYWMIVIKYLIDTNFFDRLQKNVTEFGKLLLEDIAKGTIPNEDLKKLVSKLNKDEIVETIVNIKNEICKNTQGYQMTKDKFLLLNGFLKEKANLSDKERGGDVCQYILNPISDDDDCLKIIVENSDFYVSIINSANRQGDTFKNNIKAKLQNNSDVDFISFAKKIEVEKQEQEKQEKI